MGGEAVGGGGGGAKESGPVIEPQGLLADFRKPQPPRIDEVRLIRGASVLTLWAARPWGVPAQGSRFMGTSLTRAVAKIFAFFNLPNSPSFFARREI